MLHELQRPVDAHSKKDRRGFDCITGCGAFDAIDFNAKTEPPGDIDPSSRELDHEG